MMATKEAYRKKLEAQLAQWDAQIDLWSASARKAAADTRVKYENELEGLRHRRAAAHRKLEELNERSESAWEEMKDGVAKVWDEMSKAMDKVAARFR